MTKAQGSMRQWRSGWPFWSLRHGSLVISWVFLGALLAGTVHGQVTIRFRNSAPITVRDALPAAPYPSTIQVFGLPGVVSRVTVTLSNVFHTFPADLDVLLVAPSGQKLLLMSDAGGNRPLNDVTITFDDAVATVLPENGPIVSGTYRPTNYDPSGMPDFFYEPAPPGPYTADTAVFNGISPNGTWALYVVDDAGSDAGLIAGGWSLRLTTIDPATAADLAVGMTDLRDPIYSDGKLVYAVGVTNLGPFMAQDIRLIDVLPPGLNFLFASPSQGTCTFTNGLVLCNLGDLAFEEVATVLIGTAPTVDGMVTNQVVVTASTTDFNPANSTALETTTILPADAVDLVLTLQDTPNPVILARPLTYTITITNRGPLTATGVLLTDILPATVNLLSATASQGSCNQAGNRILCSLGTLTTGITATVTIVVNPSVVGVISNTATVTANEFDISAVNSTATVGTLVFLPTDLSVWQTDSKDPASVGSNVAYTVFVFNNGPGSATGVVLSNQLPVSATFVSAVPSQGSCQPVVGGTLRCSLGTMAPNSTVTVAITVQPTFLGTLFNTATVLLNESDSNPANNTWQESTTVFPGGNGIVITPSTNALELANAITAAGSTGIRVLKANLQAHSMPFFTNIFGVQGGTSSGLYSVINPPFTYGLRGVGVVLSSGNVLDYQTGPSRSSGYTTAYSVRATTNQEALLDPITATPGRSFTHYDVTQLDVEFDLLPGFDSVQFNVVFGSDEYPEFVGSSFIDGFGIYLNGVNIAFAEGKPVNINHPSMRAMPGTELDGILAPGGNPIMVFTKFIGDGVTNNRLTFIISDTSDDVLDTTVYVSSLQGTLPPNADLAVRVTGPTNRVTVGSNLTYRVTVTNLGPNVATETVLSNTLPAGVAFVSALPSQGSCVFVGGTVICDLFNVDRNNGVVITITGTPLVEGFLTNTVMVGATQKDFVLTNNVARTTTLALNFGNFLSTEAIAVNDGAPATPYPALLAISGLSGVITQMTVTLKGLSHTFPADLDILLVGPSGQSVILMSDAGANWPIQNATLTFSDRAAQALPEHGPITSGTYRPTNYDPPDVFFAPAPPGPYGASLGQFIGTDPNGLWALYVYDDLGQDAGLIFDGWALSFGVEPPPALHIQRTNAQIVVSWLASAVGYELDWHSQLAAPTGWTTVPATPTVVSNRHTVVLEANEAARFFRLRKRIR